MRLLDHSGHARGRRHELQRHRSHRRRCVLLSRLGDEGGTGNPVTPRPRLPPLAQPTGTTGLGQGRRRDAAQLGCHLHRQPGLLGSPVGGGTWTEVATTDAGEHRAIRRVVLSLFRRNTSSACRRSPAPANLPRRTPWRSRRRPGPSRRPISRRRPFGTEIDLFVEAHRPAQPGTPSYARPTTQPGERANTTIVPATQTTYVVTGLVPPASYSFVASQSIRRASPLRFR